jgi:hypothetical protein
VDYLGFGILLWVLAMVLIVGANKKSEKPHSDLTLVLVGLLVAFACLFWPITLPVTAVICIIKFGSDLVASRK